MFGLYPAGSDWVRTFVTVQRPAREIQKSLVDHAAFTAAIFHQPFGEHRGAVLAQFGKILVLSATTPGASEIAVTPTVELQHLLWSFRQGYATQWSSLEIRTLTGYSGWDELITGVQREFVRTCEQVESAVNGTLKAPPVPETTVHTSFPDDDDHAFFLELAEYSQQPLELPPCAL
jgi:hypothetical protein